MLKKSTNYLILFVCILEADRNIFVIHKCKQVERGVKRERNKGKWVEVVSLYGYKEGH